MEFLVGIRRSAFRFKYGGIQIFSTLSRRFAPCIDVDRLRLDGYCLNGTGTESIGAEDKGSIVDEEFSMANDPTRVAAATDCWPVVEASTLRQSTKSAASAAPLALPSAATPGNIAPPKVLLQTL